MPENPSSSNTNSPHAPGKPSPSLAAVSPGPVFHHSTLPLLPNPSGFPTSLSRSLLYPLRSSQWGNEGLNVASRSVPASPEPHAHAGRPPISGEGRGWQPPSSAQRGALSPKVEAGTEGTRLAGSQKAPGLPLLPPPKPPRCQRSCGLREAHICPHAAFIRRRFHCNFSPSLPSQFSLTWRVWF